MPETAPSMHAWKQAWRAADAAALQTQYAPDAVLFAPGKPLVQGRAAILDFFQAGLGKVAVEYVPARLTISGDLAWEQGEFQDLEPGTEAVVARGHYGLSWVRQEGQWRIQCHAWTMPVR